MAQVILGPSCINVEVAWLRNVPYDDDREFFFVTAWCWHPSFIQPEQMVFIPEPRSPNITNAERTEVPGLRYLVCLQLVGFQDWSTPPPSPDGRDGDDGAGGDGDDDGADGANGHTPGADDYSGGRDSEIDDSGDSNCNHYHPGMSATGCPGSPSDGCDGG
jgi:hypothetical protein